MAQLNDPGATITDPSAHLLTAHPVNFVAESGQWLALTPTGTLLVPGHPFVTYIDGIPISRWLTEADKSLPVSLRGNTDARASQLNRLDSLRLQLGADPRKPPRLTLTNELADRHYQFWLPLTAPGEQHTADNKANRLSYLSAQAALLKVGDLDGLHGDMLEHAMSLPALIVDIRSASGNADVLISALLKRLPEKAMVPALQARYRAWGQQKAAQLQAQGFTPRPLASQSPARHADGMSVLFQREFIPVGKNSSSAAPTSLILLLGAQCRADCAQLAYVARSLPGVMVAGSTLSGDFSPRTHLHLPYSGLTLSVSTSLVYSASGHLLTGQPIHPDILLSSSQPLDWAQLTALLRRSQDGGLTAYAH
ncbi:hypothetical protein [Shewanella sp. GXUN23E]|uniref:hypothetical protein n=1 Tax=Shewanella sp. GXUN23E TaxID=3422498 RepID=UPI003D7CC217